MSNILTTSERIKALRDRAGLTQTEMGNKLGMSHTTYRSRENGDSSWRMSEMQACAEVFGVDLGDLIGGR